MAQKESKAKEGSQAPAKAEPARALSPFELMERQFENLFGRPFSMWSPIRRFITPEAFAPSVDIYEEDGNVVLKAELPGVSKEDVEVNLTDHLLTISAEKKKEEKVEEKNFYRQERYYGSFTRSFEIPTEVQADQVKAKFQDGVLEVRLPKTEEAKKKAQKVPVE